MLVCFKLTTLNKWKWVHSICAFLCDELEMFEFGFLWDKIFLIYCMTPFDYIIFIPFPNALNSEQTTWKSSDKNMKLTSVSKSIFFTFGYKDCDKMGNCSLWAISPSVAMLLKLSAVRKCLYLGKVWTLSLILTLSAASAADVHKTCNFSFCRNVFHF